MNLINQKLFLVLVSYILLLKTVTAKLVESRAQTKELQRALNHDNVVIVLDGVLERLRGSPSPDPLVLINFHDLDTQFKVHILEDTNTIKFTLASKDGKSKEFYRCLRIKEVVLG